MELDRAGEARQAADERLKRLPDDHIAMRALFSLVAAARHYDEADRWGRRLVEKGTSAANDLQQVGSSTWLLAQKRLAVLGAAAPKITR